MTSETLREFTLTEIQRDRDRGVKFLGTMSRSPDIRRIMAGRGYTEVEHQLGWSLLLASLGWSPPKEAGAEPGAPPISQEQAIAELDQWDGPSFSVARAALRRLHPDQESYIFKNLSAQTGSAAVGSVNTYLQRVSALRDGTDPEREVTREADRAAVVTLETRKVAGEELEAHLRDLIGKATKLAPPPAEPATEPLYAELQTTARALHDWLSDWRETARALVTRRDYQLRLGLVEARRKPKEEGPDGG